MTTKVDNTKPSDKEALGVTLKFVAPFRLKNPLPVRNNKMKTHHHDEYEEDSTTRSSSQVPRYPSHLNVSDAEWHYVHGTG